MLRRKREAKMINAMSREFEMRRVRGAMRLRMRKCEKKRFWCSKRLENWPLMCFGCAPVFVLVIFGALGRPLHAGHAGHVAHVWDNTLRDPIENYTPGRTQV